MKLSSLIACGLLCATLAIAQTPASQAAASANPALPPPPTLTGPSKVGIVDIQVAIMTTEEGKKLNDELTARFKPKKDELAAENADLQTLNSKLNAGQQTMSATAKQELTNEISAKQRDLQQSSDNAQTDYQNAQTDMMNTVGTKMIPLLNQYAKDHGYTAILDVSFPWPQGPVLYHDPGAVITGDLIKMYDQKYPVAASSTAGH